MSVGISQQRDFDDSWSGTSWFCFQAFSMDLLYLLEILLLLRLESFQDPPNINSEEGAETNLISTPSHSDQSFTNRPKRNWFNQAKQA
jgi:hypothetical protein